MRITTVNHLQGNEELAKPILGPDGRILLQSGVRLNEGYIRRLKALGYRYVYIHDSVTSDIVLEESVTIETRQRVVSQIKRLYDDMRNPDSFQRVIRSGTIAKVFTDAFQALFEEIQRSKTLVVHLSAIFANDAYLYTHSMNVGVFAIALSVASHHSKARTKDIGIGAMLHDIGKLRLDAKILQKTGPLTPEEKLHVQEHCWYGYEMLTKITDVSAVSAHCALEHHERFDGLGYPRGLRGTEIHEVGRLLAVVDVYDALTSNRSYRTASLPHEGLEYLFAQSGSQFDSKYVDMFKNHINIYPPGLPVELSFGGKGIVARSNPEHLQRPVVLVLEEQGKQVTPYEVDLSKVLNVVITKYALDSVDKGRA